MLGSNTFFVRHRQRPAPAAPPVPPNEAAVLMGAGWSAVQRPTIENEIRRLTRLREWRAHPVERDAEGKAAASGALPPRRSRFRPTRRRRARRRYSAQDTADMNPAERLQELADAAQGAEAIDKVEAAAQMAAPALRAETAPTGGLGRAPRCPRSAGQFPQTAAAPVGALDTPP